MDSLGLALFGSSLTGARCVYAASSRANTGSKQVVVNAPSSGWDVALCTLADSLVRTGFMYMTVTPSSGTVYVNSAFAIVVTSNTLTYKITTDGEMASASVFYAAFFEYN